MSSNNNFYHLTVSVGHRSRCSLAESSTSAPLQAAIKLSAELESSQGSTGDPIPSLLECRVQFLVDHWIQGPDAFHCLCPLFLSTLAVPWGSLQHGSCFIRTHKKEVSKRVSRRGVPVLYSLISKVTFPHFYHILLIRSKSPGPAYTQGRGLHKDAWYAYHILEHL